MFSDTGCSHVNLGVLILENQKPRHAGGIIADLGITALGCTFKGI